MDKKDISARHLLNKLPPTILNLLLKIGKLADRMNFAAYIVGGFVRDLFLGVENLDLDVVVEGDGIRFAGKLSEKLDAQVTVHERFKTAVLSLPDGLRIDVATARKEFYAHPGALPDVSSASIRDDLFRRDFTINAMAIKLNPSGFGSLVDFFCGGEDLKKKRIRVLHELLFVDDPTRILRAIRFEQRFDFSMERKTENLLKGALKSGVFRRLTPQRIRDEMILLLSEPRPEKSILRLDQVGGMGMIYPGLRLNHGIYTDLKNVRKVIPLLPFPEKGVERWLVYFLVLTRNLKGKDVLDLCRNLHFSKKQIEKVIKAREALKLKKEDFFKFKNLPGEAAAFLLLKTGNISEREKIIKNLKKLKKTRVFITGDDLKGFGYKEGPLIGKILEKVFKAKLKGFLRSRKDEIKFVVDNFPKEI